jgi:trehalose/maltose hydrolase-like predicted phosphorylase
MKFICEYFYIGHLHFAMRDVTRLEESYRLFKHASMMDLIPDYSRGLFANGIHPCGLAGAWLTIVHGYSGITLKNDSIHWRKHNMPSHD